MKFISFGLGNVTGLAVQTEDGLRGLTTNDASYPGDLDQLVHAGDGALANAAAVLAKGGAVDPATIKYLPPFRAAEKILCVGLNYHDHRAETGQTTVSNDYPTVFGRFNSSLIGHEAPIMMPTISTALDYEAELVAVIGKGGRNIAEADALDHVVGYAVFNDGSIRDYQLRTSQWTIGKNFDDTGAFGPEFVTADELPAGAAGLKIECRLNGETVQSANTDDLIFTVARLVSLISEAMTLRPGDLIVTGTPGGVGMARKPPLWMKPGDVCEVEIEKVGLLRNPIVAA